MVSILSFKTLPNLNKEIRKFSNYRFNYKIGKKNKVKFSLYDTSKNRNICEFYSA